MPDAVVIDTNILPMWRGLDGPLWLSVRKLCEVLGIVVYLPEIVVLESVNLRRDAFASSAAEFLESLRKVGKFVDLAPIYVADESEICESWEQELRDVFTVVPIDGDDAVDALHREAQRIRPARNGTGARDSAIWMTALRIAEAHQTVYFVSNNTADFAAGKQGQLHEHLASERDAASLDLRYLKSIYGLIEALAESIDPPALDEARATEMLNVNVRELALAEMKSDSRYMGISPVEVPVDGVAVNDLNAIHAYSIDDRSLALVRGSAALTVGNAADHVAVEVSFLAWIEFEGGAGEPLSGEVESVTLV